MGEEVLFDVATLPGTAIVVLSRERALNCLTEPMVRAIAAKLVEWATDASVRRVVVVGAGPKAFCAGGDIKRMAVAAHSGDLSGCNAFFAAEYALDEAFGRFEAETGKTIVALVGARICMGGGVGVSVHGRCVVVSPGARFAMPETAIGFCPDVGATYWLAAAPGRMGEYLATTGATFGAADAVWLGWAAVSTKQCSGTTQEAVELGRIADADHAGDTRAAVAAMFPADAEGEAPLAILAAGIDRIFALPSVGEIEAALAAEPAEWAAHALGVLGGRSALSKRAALRMVRQARDEAMDVEACLRMEHGVGSHIIQEPDFYEGVRVSTLRAELPACCY